MVFIELIAQRCSNNPNWFRAFASPSHSIENCISTFFTRQNKKQINIFRLGQITSWFHYYICSIQRTADDWCAEFHFRIVAGNFVSIIYTGAIRIHLILFKVCAIATWKYILYTIHIVTLSLWVPKSRVYMCVYNSRNGREHFSFFLIFLPFHFERVTNTCKCTDVNFWTCVLYIEKRYTMTTIKWMDEWIQCIAVNIDACYFVLVFVIIAFKWLSRSLKAHTIWAMMYLTKALFSMWQ